MVFIFELFQRLLQEFGVALELCISVGGVPDFGGQSDVFLSCQIIHLGHVSDYILQCKLISLILLCFLACFHRTILKVLFRRPKLVDGSVQMVDPLLQVLNLLVSLFELRNMMLQVLHLAPIHTVQVI